ncbi:DUF2834 domain-containing protein [Solimonas sp. K1W22B-7]|uniref:DUF2834 domain-containing protein n=1 Tax=Solimonas sp. K1W22B-7 TaxID=2303331 RepID=UPI000E33791B|nr:DUF2834 domain-containing protein [Solimonas sp. K1W22B-7]AXQ31334.1 DUF2834 domain-containing protein [Solimonas sp. K1W22B-7]
MNLNTVLLMAVFAAFGVLSLIALAEHGYVGLFLYQFQTTAGWQVLADLVVACLVGVIWMVGDARRNGRQAWPYILMTVALGSFGLLAYLLVGQFSGAKERHALA